VQSIIAKRGNSCKTQFVVHRAPEKMSMIDYSVRSQTKMIDRTEHKSLGQEPPIEINYVSNAGINAGTTEMNIASEVYAVCHPVKIL
jgi:hypothetical protein